MSIIISKSKSAKFQENTEASCVKLGTSLFLESTNLEASGNIHKSCS